MKRYAMVTILVLTQLFFYGIGFAADPLPQGRVEADNSELAVSEVNEKKSLKALKPKGSEVGSNTFYGLNAGNAYAGDITMISNTFIGNNAGYTQERGSGNTFVGALVGQETNPGPTTGEGIMNTFVGARSGEKNTTGAENVFVGYGAGFKNTKGENNICIGHSAGEHNETADNNIFIGSKSGNLNTSGIRNTYVGYSSGLRASSNSNNTYIGFEAGRNNEGSDNTFIGRASGKTPSSGLIHSGKSNTCVGAESGESIRGADYNVILGKGSGTATDYGDYNCFVGHESGYSNRGGDSNTYIGNWAGYSNVSGEGNVFIGNSAGFIESGSEKLYIDNTGTPSPLIWGDFDADKVIINGDFRAIGVSSSSDGRWKKNIEPLLSSLDKVNLLQGVSYEWKTEVYPDLGLNHGKQIGLVAQQVEDVLPELVSKDKDGYKSVSYSKLTAVLVEAVKELTNENRLHRQHLAEQEKRFLKQQAEIRELKAVIRKLNPQLYGQFNGRGIADG